MDLVLIRHGVTAWNQQRRFQGQIDTPLSEEGHQQAMLTARHLSTLSQAQPINAIYASDLKRAWSTAEPIARLLGLPILKQSLLRERHYGVFEGKTHEELQLDRSPPNHGIADCRCRPLSSSTVITIGGSRHHQHCPFLFLA